MSNLAHPAYGAVESVDESVFKQPMLQVVVDTEEEFNWSEPHSRSETSVSSMREIHKVQSVFDKHGVKPCYVIDYPIVSQKEGYEPLLEIYKDGKCSIGAHLHPWVNPPFNEEVNAFNSFPGNLPEDLEHEKLKILTEEIGTLFGDAPIAYKAGRYGFGKNTAGVMARLGLKVDLSPTPGFDYSHEGGPDFSQVSNSPFWFGADSACLGIPCTGGFTGILGSKAASIYRAITGATAKSMHIPGVMARLGILERLRLSPEGFTTHELTKITDFLVANGDHKIMTLSFHSPSVKEGCTPYVKTLDDVSRFLNSIDTYLEYFVEKRGGVFTTPKSVFETLSNARLAGNI